MLEGRRGSGISPDFFDIVVSDAVPLGECTVRNDEDGFEVSEELGLDQKLDLLMLVELETRDSGRLAIACLGPGMR